MTNKPPSMAFFSLARRAAPCYTPAAMADRISQPSPNLLLHILAEELQADDHYSAMAHLASLLAERAGLADARPLMESALLREESEPTYLGKGMALPHARVAGLPCAGVCIAHSVEGIPWNGERAQLVIFLAVPEEAPELYLKLMSRLVRWRLRLPEDALRTPTLPAAAWEEELGGLLA